MKLFFSKYHGAGNDFIIIDNRTGHFIAEKELIKNLCHRQFGIGADGLMLLEEEPNADFCMRYFNSDGSESTMCGNGGRCITLFAQNLGIIKDQTRFIGIDGEHTAIIKSDNSVRIKMMNVQNVSQEDNCYFLDTGSPHCVRFVDNVGSINVDSEGCIMRNKYQPHLGGVNVNFVEMFEEGLRIRTYERGVEGETLACGTGSVAAAIAANIKFDKSRQIFKIFARGGNLSVSFEKSENDQFYNIWLEGPVAHVFDGTIEIT